MFHVKQIGPTEDCRPQNTFSHQGLAKIVADRMCREIISQGKKPVWAHALANEGSKYTALGVGFTNDRVNTVIRKS